MQLPLVGEYVYAAVGGIHAGVVGKWHLGFEDDRNSLTPGPLGRSVIISFQLIWTTIRSFILKTMVSQSQASWMSKELAYPV
jgi:hypothetical protein